MKFSEFAGLDPKMEQLMRSAQAGRIVHALLFSGPRGTGKKTMAEIFARAVLCEGAHKPCDACSACKKVLNGSHPDVHYVAPEKKQIKIDQIRDLTETLGLASYEGGMKIAIIEHADSMNENAQNALLKSLENPTGDTLFFLLTDVPVGAQDALLPTIVSRCLQVRFNCLPVQDCAGVLMSRGVEAERAQLLSALAQGSVGRALEMDADPDYLDLYRRVNAAVAMLRSPADVAIATASMGETKGRENAVLEILELYARDLMRQQNGASPLNTQNTANTKHTKYSGSALLRRIMLARRQYTANIPWTNILETLMFDIARGSL